MSSNVPPYMALALFRPYRSLSPAPKVCSKKCGIQTNKERVGDNHFAYESVQSQVFPKYKAAIESAKRAIADNMRKAAQIRSTLGDGDRQLYGGLVGQLHSYESQMRSHMQRPVLLYNKPKCDC